MLFLADEKASSGREGDAWESFSHLLKDSDPLKELILAALEAFPPLSDSNQDMRLA